MLLNPFDDLPARAPAKMGATIALLAITNIVAWLWAFAAFADHPALLGTALLAYVFGLRHAFDADHIAAIDNVVRKLAQQGKAPYSAGLFFALGHSTIVVIASAGVAATAAALQSRFIVFQNIGGFIGTSISAVFLLMIGIANLFILKGVWSAFRRVRQGGRTADGDIDMLLGRRGFAARLFRPLFSMVSRSWHLYPIGFLFALGFDTATEIGLLGLSATQAAQGTVFWKILVFPALFTAGMALMDTVDSLLMTRAYGWALSDPVRKLWYNLTVTAASVAVALFIGGIEALGLIGDRFGRQHGFWRLIGNLNDNLTGFGFAFAGIFMVSWLISTLVYRAKGYGSLLR